MPGQRNEKDINTSKFRRIGLSLYLVTKMTAKYSRKG